MAAIWGIINRNPKNESSDAEKLFTKMGNSMSGFPIDRIDTVNCTTGFFACGHQYLTNEDQSDVSPITDNDSQVIFCSDCFLYNRDYLIKELNDSSLINAGDSLLAYNAFKHWGYSFVEKLRGNFSFAIYEINTGCLHLFTDHLSKQYLTYSVLSDYIMFSTIYKPILACLDGKEKINREFIINSYRDVSPASFYKKAITPFENIYHLDYASHVTIDVKTGKKSIKQYWNPLKNIKKLKLNSDDEYKAAFKSVFKSITQSMLRSKDETGIMLSGGLDSASVASFIAPMLKTKEKNLYSYTSVPSTGYIAEEHNPYYMPDESSFIKIQEKFYDNLIPRYINGDNDSCITNIDSFQKLYNIPDKAPFNLINIVNMLKAAQKDNCSVIFSGENGNSNISYGYITDYMSINARKFHFIKAYKQMAYYCKTYNLSRLKFSKIWLKEAFSYYFKKPVELSNLLKEEDKTKYGLKHPALDAKRELGSRSFVSEKQKNNYVIMPESFTQRGFYYTHLGLQYHMIQLDPTLTVEMIEFCLRLPMECFVYNGIDRRLVRDYLKDQMPEAITDVKKGRGIQAVDIHYRVNRDFDNYKEKIFKLLDEPLLKDYLDEEKLNKTVKEVKEAAENHNLDRAQAVNLTLIATLAEFLKAHTKQ